MHNIIQRILDLFRSKPRPNDAERLEDAWDQAIK